MDQPQSASPQDGSRITLDPAMRPVSTAPAKRSTPKTRPARWPVLLGLVGLLMGGAALGTAIWSYDQAQKDIRRLSTDLAQLRVSLDLYARNGSGKTPELTDLTARLTALEQNLRGATVPLPQTEAADAAPAAGANQGEDCLPVGMRLLVAAGDSYPICQQGAEVAVSAVDNGYITLRDGTAVPSGGTMPLPDSSCTIAVTSGGDEGLTGYAEIRVSC